MLWQHFWKGIGKNPWDVNQDFLRIKLWYQISWNHLSLQCTVLLGVWVCSIEVGKEQKCLLEKPRVRIEDMFLCAVPLLAPRVQESLIWQTFIWSLCAAKDNETQEQGLWDLLFHLPKSLLWKHTQVKAIDCFGLWGSEASWLHLLPAQNLPEVIGSRRGSHTAWVPSFVRLLSSFSLGFYFLPKATVQWIAVCPTLGFTFKKRRFDKIISEAFSCSLIT